MTAAARRRLLGERIARHGLADRPCDSPVAAALRTTALQAQDSLASRLGVRARAHDVTDADVARAVALDRTISRTWLMRGTIHLVATADLHWLVRLIGPSVARRFRTRWQRLGLTEDIVAAIADTLPELLADGPRTRAEIRDGLAERGIVLDSPDPQAYAHVIVSACCTGQLCRGPDRGTQSTFVLTADWVPDAPAGPSGDDALAELARRYFAAYSPATATDFAAWSGMGVARAIALIRDELAEADVDGRPGYRLGQVEPAGGVRLLPAFDNYLIGYRGRDAVVTGERYGEIFHGGMIRPTVLVDGAVAGRWALDRVKGHVAVIPYTAFGRAVRARVDEEVADIGRFLGRELSWSPGEG